MYDLGELLLSEKSLLVVFSVLPAENIRLELLDKLLPSRSEGLDDTLAALVQKGWLDKDQREAAFPSLCV